MHILFCFFCHRQNMYWNRGEVYVSQYCKQIGGMKAITLFVDLSSYCHLKLRWFRMRVSNAAAYWQPCKWHLRSSPSFQNTVAGSSLPHVTHKTIHSFTICNPRWQDVGHWLHWNIPNHNKQLWGMLTKMNTSYLSIYNTVRCLSYKCHCA